MKNPLTPAGIEPATFRFVEQHLNHCATAVSPLWRSTRNLTRRSLPSKCHTVLRYTCERNLFYIYKKSMGFFQCGFSRKSQMINIFIIPNFTKSDNDCEKNGLKLIYDPKGSMAFAMRLAWNSDSLSKFSWKCSVPNCLSKVITRRYGMPSCI